MFAVLVLLLHESSSNLHYKNLEVFAYRAKLVSMSRVYQQPTRSDPTETFLYFSLLPKILRKDSKSRRRRRENCSNSLIEPTEINVNNVEGTKLKVGVYQPQLHFNQDVLPRTSSNHFPLFTSKYI